MIKKYLKSLLFCFLASLAPLSLLAQDKASNELRLFIWDGYVTPEELDAVNKLIKDAGLDITAKIISAKAESPDQMFRVLRSGEADISFLTLNYIMMSEGKTASLLQPINVNSPRLSNYANVLDSLKDIPMGMRDGKPLYVAYGGGAYGIWADMTKVKEEELPTSVNDLWDKKWKGKISLTSGQFQPNIALAALALGLKPFVINDDALDRKKLKKHAKLDSPIAVKTAELYAQVGSYWDVAPDFTNKDIVFFADYGGAAAGHIASGGTLKLLNFKEGNTAWLDTMNIHKDVKGKKLEAAEIFINYFIGQEVQTRVSEGLGMVAASKLAKSNKLIDENPDFFNKDMFWLPYLTQADNVMKKIADEAIEKAKK